MNSGLENISFGMRNELTEELACAIGFDLIYRGDYFILGAIVEPTIKGKIIYGVAKDLIVCYDTSPNGLDKLPSEAAIAYAQRVILAAYFANCVEGMTVIEPEKKICLRIEYLG